MPYRLLAVSSLGIPADLFLIALDDTYIYISPTTLQIPVQ